MQTKAKGIVGVYDRAFSNNYDALFPHLGTVRRWCLLPSLVPAATPPPGSESHISKPSVLIKVSGRRAGVWPGAGVWLGYVPSLIYYAEFMVFFSPPPVWLSN